MHGMVPVSIATAYLLIPTEKRVYRPTAGLLFLLNCSGLGTFSDAYLVEYSTIPKAARGLAY
jgi:hypothetical protein